MRSFKFLLLVFCFGWKLLPAQIDVPDSPFVKLRNGHLLTGQNLQLTERAFAASTIQLDGQTFKTRDVLFYKDNQGLLYARMNGVLTENIYNNNNFYFFRTISYSSGPGLGIGMGMGYGGGFGGYGGYSTRINYAYSVGLSDLQPVKLDNVARDMSSDPIAAGFIRKAKSQRNWARISIAGAVGGFLLTFSNVNSRNTNVIYGGLGIMLGGSISATVFSGLKRKNTRRAVKAFTGFDFMGEPGL